MLLTLGRGVRWKMQDEAGDDGELRTGRHETEVEHSHSIERFIKLAIACSWIGSVLVLSMSRYIANHSFMSQPECT